MNGDSLRRKAARAALRKWPVVITRVSEQLMPLNELLEDSDREEITDAYQRFLPREEPEPQEIVPREASLFVQLMENTEAELRVQVSGEGCVCGMQVRAKPVQAIPGGFVMAIQTAHDPWCPWMQKLEGTCEEEAA